MARLARIAVFTRPGYELPAGEAIVVPMAAMPLSASDIRARATRGETLEDAVPPAVANYIAEKRLYQ